MIIFKWYYLNLPRVIFRQIGLVLFLPFIHRTIYFVSPSWEKGFSCWGKSSVDENSIVEGAQLMELPFDVGAKIVKIRHIILCGRAVSWNNTNDGFLSLFLSFWLSHSILYARFYTLFTKLRKGSFGNSTGAWHVATRHLFCHAYALARSFARSSYARTSCGPKKKKSKEYYFKTRYGVKA